MADMNQQFDAKLVSCAVQASDGTSFVIRAYADGVMFTFEDDADAYTKHIGAQGNGRQIRSNDQSGQGTIRIADYSGSNDDLSELFRKQIPFTIAVTDKTTKATKATFFDCRIRKMPILSRDGGEAIMNEWPITYIDRELFLSGAREYTI